MARPLTIPAVPLPVVEPDPPTGRTERLPTPGAAESASKAKPASIDDALASKDRAINNRVPDDLWALVAARADQIGVKLRPLLTDALVRALELEPEKHREQIDETARRQAYARIGKR